MRERNKGQGSKMREGIKSEERRQGNGAGNRRNEGIKSFFLIFFIFFKKIL